MIVQFLSDLHLDVNRDYPFTLTPRDDIRPNVLVVAGDTCGDTDEAVRFIRKAHVDGGYCNTIVVCGNHIVYNNGGKTLEQLKMRLHEEFPLDGDITFLDESVGVVSKEIGGVLFVGSCTYTDYRYRTFGSGMKRVVETNMMASVQLRMSQPSYMNDFQFGKTDEPPPFKRGKAKEPPYRLIPHHYKNYFHRTRRAFEKVLRENADKTVVLVTHHCLSQRCIGETMNKGSLAASYVSPMEPFIKRHANIKAVISGHVHNSLGFDITRDDGSVCKYLMNPRGYTGRHESDGWTPYAYLDTDDWSVSLKPYSNKAWDEILKKADERFMSAFRRFGACFC